MRRMGRFAMQLNPRIRDILIAAQLEQGMSAAETARAAQAGELEGLPPTRVSETSCGELRAEAERERGNYSLANTPGPPTDQAEASERAYLEQQIARIRAIEEPTAKQITTLREAMRGLEDIEKRATRRAPRRPEPEPEDVEERKELCYRLLFANGAGGPVLPAWWSKRDWRAEWESPDTGAVRLRQAVPVGYERGRPTGLGPRSLRRLPRRGRRQPALPRLPPACGGRPSLAPTSLGLSASAAYGED